MVGRFRSHAKQHVEQVTQNLFRIKTTCGKALGFLFGGLFCVLMVTKMQIIEWVQSPLPHVVFWWLPWEFLHSTERQVPSE